MHGSHNNSSTAQGPAQNRYIPPATMSQPPNIGGDVAYQAQSQQFIQQMMAKRNK